MDLNWAYAKDSFLLPKIDQLVDLIVGNGLLTSMDVFSRYSQIQISLED